jgi:hypothetical protein
MVSQSFVYNSTQPSWYGKWRKSAKIGRFKIAAIIRTKLKGTSKKSDFLRMSNQISALSALFFTQKAISRDALMHP